MPYLHLCSLSSLLENWKIGRRKVPAYVLFLSLFAATGGLMFGYDIGVSGGVTVMDEFLCQFFPNVLEEKIKKQGLDGISCNNITRNESEKTDKEKNHQELQYCLFGSQNVQLFTSSLYLAAMGSTFFAAYVSRKGGRKITIHLASIFYLVGVVLNIASGSIPNRHHAAFLVLIFGRIMLGFGVGFGNQAIPLFISEIAPANARGSLNYLFQLNVTIGILLANIVNWGAQKIYPWGWRLSLGLAGIPAVLLTMGSFFLVETPSSLVQRGLQSEAQEVLNSIRGQGVEADLDLQGIIAASCGNNHTHNLTQGDTSKKRFHGLFSRSNRPPLLIAIFVQLFQQFTGINMVNLYTPVLFQSFGSETDLSLLITLIIGTFHVAFTIFSIFVVDRIGRRRLLLIASAVMFFAQLLIGIVLIGTTHHLEQWRAIVVAALLCAFVSAYSCSWGPLGWLISTEIFPLACRSEGQSVTVFFNMLFTFLIAHTSLSMLCHLKFGIFFFFSLWLAIMGTLSFLFLPETMNMEIETIFCIWGYHRFWKHFITSPHPHPRATSPPHPPQVRVLASPFSVTSQASP